MKIIISVILIFSLLFNSLTCFASDIEESSAAGHSRGGSFTLGDVVHNRHGVGSRGGGFQHFVGYEGDDFNAQNFLNQPVMTVLSSVAAIAPKDNLVQQIVTDLLLNEDFLDAVIFNPYDKIMSWNDVAGRHAGDTIRKYIESAGTVYIDNWLQVPNRVNCNMSNGRLFKLNLDSGDYGYVCLVQRGTTSYIVGGSLSSAGMLGLSNGSPTGVGFVISARSGYAKTIYASDNWTSGNLMPFEGGTLNGSFVTPYSSLSAAYAGLAGGVASSQPVPNGDGYLRPLPPNKTIYSTSNNIYNNNWPDIIHNNYTIYGDSFENTVLNTYYYTVPSDSTPNYWYDIYDNDSVTLPAVDYDLDDITLSSPELTTNNNFLNTLFGAFPSAFSGLFLALLMLSVVIIFLRG